MDILQLTSQCLEIEKLVEENYVDPSGNSSPIYDGIVNVDRYVKATPKILWVLKEPYDDEDNGQPSGGDWYFGRDFLGLDNPKFGRSRSTWHPIVYVCFGIFNDLLYEQMDYIRDLPEMSECLKDIAVINVKKLPGFTRTPDFGPIQEAYSNHKHILHKQIKTYDPDVIIGGSTMKLFYPDFEIAPEQVRNAGTIAYVIKDNKILIDAYHPAQTQVTHKDYVNDIIHAVKNYLNNNHQTA